jgi:hypothetical protein
MNSKVFGFNILNFVFNEIEYFTYFNLWLVGLFFWIIFFVIFIFSSIFIFGSIFSINGFIELILCLVFGLIFLIVIILGFVLISQLSFYYLFGLFNFNVFVISMQWVFEFGVGV